MRDELLARSGCRADLGKLRAELLQTPPNYPGVFVPLWQLERDFPRFREIIPVTAPVYGLVFVRVRGFYERAAQPEVWTAEGAMYEDMALAVNDLIDLGEVREEHEIYKHKRENWLIRSVILSAFFFVESYLNGIAVECLVTRWDSLSANERKLLAEYDFETQKARWLSFRDKFLKYPRIAKDAEHPVLQEGNDVDARMFLGEFRELRDAIVHASHRPAARESEVRFEKLERLFQLLKGRRAALDCADCAVRLVRKLAAVIGRKPESLVWLIERDPTTGRFPARAFG